MITLRNDSGDSLIGAVDGVNATFTTQLAMRFDKPVDVYVNGQCLFAAMDNGYSFPDAQTLVLKEVPLPGDTVSVRYCASPIVVGVPGAQVTGLAAMTEGAGLPLQAQIRDAEGSLTAHLRLQG